MSLAGPFNVLNLIEGWDHRDYPIPSTVVQKTRATPILEITKWGWLQSIVMVSNDSYGALRIRYKGAGGREISGTVFAEIAVLAGNWQVDSGGYVTRYYRPNPASSAGIYYVSVISGLEGTPLPYREPVIVEGILMDDSTQNSALVSGSISVLEIRDLRLFLNSLKATTLFLNDRLDLAALQKLDEWIEDGSKAQR